MQDEIDWELKVIQDRYHLYKITPMQAEKIKAYEEEKASFVYPHHLSFWEEMDFEWTVLKDIFTEKQWRLYEKHSKKSIEQYTASLKESDRSYQKQINYQEELIQAFREKLLSELWGKETMTLRMWMREEQTKLVYLKTEYGRFLASYKSEILTSHFRHYKTHQPLLLRASLLRHALLTVFPDYRAFKGAVDAPTKAVALHLEERVKYSPDEVTAYVNRTMKTFLKFQNKLFKKHHKDYPGGWHVVVGKESEEELTTALLMSVLLLDQKASSPLDL